MEITLIIIGAALFVSFILLLILNIALRNKALKELDLEDSFFNFCNINSVVHYGRPSIFDSLPNRYKRHQMFSIKDGEIYMMPYSGSTKYSLKNLIKFKKEDIVSCEKFKRVMNLTFYRITINTGDVLDLLFTIVSDDRDEELEKLLA